MNKAEKVAVKAQLTSEEKALKELKTAYRKARKDIQEQIRLLNARDDLQNLQSIIYQKKYQEILLEQIDEALKDLKDNQYTTLDEFFNGSYVNGYVGSMYNFSSQGIPILMPIDPKKIERAIRTESKLSRNYYRRGDTPENISKLKKSVRMELSRGIAGGKTWIEMAYQVANGMNSPFKKALNDANRIIRTEGHRINQQGFLDAGDDAIESGADVVKQWDSTLDGFTRPWHREADGQIREWNEYFDVGGEKMKAPSIGGSARNVCNCRCQLLQRAKWAMDEKELQTLKERAQYFKLDKSDSFESFKKKYLNLPKDANRIKLITDYKIPKEDDYDRIRKASQKVVSKSDKNQIKGRKDKDGNLQGYVGSRNYININSALRDDGYTIDDLTQDDLETIDSLRRAISKYELDDDYVMTRYVNADYISDIFDIRCRTWKTAPDEPVVNSIVKMGNSYVRDVTIPKITKELKDHIGETINEKGFLSTSILSQKNIMKDKAVRINVLANKGTHCYIPVNRKESECIFEDGIDMLIRDVDWDDEERKWVLTFEIKQKG